MGRIDAFRLAVSVFIVMPLFFPAIFPLGAGEAWPAAGEALTSDECGSVSLVEGMALARRMYAAASSPAGQAGEELLVSDRLHTGSEIEAAQNGKLEWIAGHNCIMLLDSGGKARLNGLRKPIAQDRIADPVRLDIELPQGALRVQVRRNMYQPETVLVTLPGFEALLERGDAHFSAEGPRQVLVLAGSVLARTRHGDSAGAPFVIKAGQALGADGPEPVAEDDIKALRRALPFSFEKIKAALPPQPSSSSALEAP